MAASGFTDNQGVDSCDIPSTNDLTTTLWVGTPFFDYGWYIGGAEARAVGCAAWSSSLLSTARTTGWGFTPIYDDLQAPTGCGPVINGVRYDFAARMSISTSTAYSQGVTSASNARSAMTAAGFSTFDLVWLDIEAYDTTQAACKAAVDAYVNGWSATVQADGGVYGSSSGSAVLDWEAITSPPWAVWLANTGTAANSVWNVSPVDNSHWVLDRRMHQYRTSQHTYPVSMPHGYDVDCLNTWADQGTVVDSESAESAESSSQTGDATCNGTTQ